MKQFLVEVGNPEAFDKTIQSLGPAALMSPLKGYYNTFDGKHIMRIFDNVDFIKLAIENQGYGKIIREISDDELNL